jgi:hypothetical protein
MVHKAVFGFQPTDRLCGEIFRRKKCPFLRYAIKTTLGVGGIIVIGERYVGVVNADGP